MNPHGLLPFASIFHPTDFSSDSFPAFVHALRMAVAARAELSMMHVDPDVTRAHFEDFPRVRPLLERWGLLPPHSTKAAVAADLGLRIKKIRATDRNPTAALLGYLGSHRADLLVMATHQRDGLDRWRHEAVAEPVARARHTATLFVPHHTAGFVEPESGRAHLRQILIPIGGGVAAQAAADMTAALVGALGAEDPTMTLLNVEDGSTPPKPVRYAPRDGWSWRTVTSAGPLVESILDARRELDADLVAMTTHGHESLLDMLRGSTTERVLRAVHCPLLAVPVAD